MHALHNVARCDETREALASEPDVVNACVAALESDDAAVCERAAAVLACLAEAGRRAGVIAAGGVEALLRQVVGGTSVAQQEVMRALCSLADDAGSHAALATGGLWPIVRRGAWRS